jgi:hypothetical protein
VLCEEIAKPSHVLLEPAVGQEAPVARQDLGLREELLGSVLVGITENKLSRFERCPGPRRRLLAGSLDDHV